MVGRFFCSWLFGIYLQMEITGIWLGMFMDWCIKALCFMIYYKGKWAFFRICQSSAIVKLPILKSKLHYKFSHEKFAKKLEQMQSRDFLV